MHFLTATDSQRAALTAMPAHANGLFPFGAVTNGGNFLTFYAYNLADAISYCERRVNRDATSKRQMVRNIVTL